MRNFLLSVRQIIQFQFWPHRHYCHVILGLQLLRKYDVLSIFQDVCRGRSILLQVSYFLMSLPSESQNLSTNQISLTSMVNIYQFMAGILRTTSGLEKQMSTILEFYFRFQSRPFSRNLHFILHQAAEFRTNRSSHCGNITSYRFIKMAALDAEYYFRFRICWHRCLQKVKVYEQTKFRRHISIDSWNLTTSVFKKQTSAILEFYFQFWSWSLPVICMSFCITIPNFVQIRAPTAEIWHHFHFSRWRPRPLNTSSGFVFVDVTVFRRSKSISKINFVEISQMAAEI